MKTTFLLYLLLLTAPVAALDLPPPDLLREQILANQRAAEARHSRSLVTFASSKSRACPSRPTASCFSSSSTPA